MSDKPEIHRSADELHEVLSKRPETKADEAKLEGERAAFLSRFNEVLERDAYINALKQMGFVKKSSGYIQELTGGGEPVAEEHYEISRNGITIQLIIEHDLVGKKAILRFDVLPYGNSDFRVTSDPMEDFSETEIIPFVEKYMSEHGLMESIEE